MEQGSGKDLSLMWNDVFQKGSGPGSVRGLKSERNPRSADDIGSQTPDRDWRYFCYFPGAIS